MAVLLGGLLFFFYADFFLLSFFFPRKILKRHYGDFHISFWSYWMAQKMGPLTLELYTFDEHAFCRDLKGRWLAFSPFPHRGRVFVARSWFLSLSEEEKKEVLLKAFSKVDSFKAFLDLLVLYASFLLLFPFLVFLQFFYWIPGARQIFFFLSAPFFAFISFWATKVIGRESVPFDLFELMEVKKVRDIMPLLFRCISME